MLIVKYLRLFNHAFNLSTKRSIVRVDASDAADVGIAETIILMLIRVPEKLPSIFGGKNRGSDKQR